MRARFKGEADGLPCEVFGLVFPVGEWVDVEGAALKLAGNPMFDVEGLPERNPFDHDGDGRSGGGPKGGLRKEPEPEPDPEADEDPPAAVIAPTRPAEPVLTDDDLREQLTAKGIKFHHRAGREKLQALLDDAKGGGAKSRL